MADPIVVGGLFSLGGVVVGAGMTAATAWLLERQRRKHAEAERLREDERRRLVSANRYVERLIEAGYLLSRIDLTPEQTIEALTSIHAAILGIGRAVARVDHPEFTASIGSLNRGAHALVLVQTSRPQLRTSGRDEAAKELLDAAKRFSDSAREVLSVMEKLRIPDS